MYITHCRAPSPICKLSYRSPNSRWFDASFFRKFRYFSHPLPWKHHRSFFFDVFDQWYNPFLCVLQYNRLLIIQCKPIKRKWETVHTDLHPLSFNVANITFEVNQNVPYLLTFIRIMNFSTLILRVCPLRSSQWTIPFTGLENGWHSLRNNEGSKLNV